MVKSNDRMLATKVWPTPNRNGLATLVRKRNHGKMGSVPNFQRRLVWQVNWKY